MYGILVLCLLLRPMAFSSDNNTTVIQPSNDRPERRARDGDYIGCFDFRCIHFDFDLDGLDNLTTPDSCTATCKEYGFPFAGVYNGTNCSCSCEQTCRNKPLDDDNCGLPCRSAPNELCGGYTAGSVYTVHLSVTPSNTTCNTLTEKDIPMSVGPGPWIRLFLFAYIIFTVVAIVMILYAIGLLIKIITTKYRNRINTERHRMSSHDNRDQDRDARVASVTQCQPVKEIPKLPDIPQADGTATASSGAEVNDGIYEDPDLNASSVPTAGIVLAHEYLVLGQEVPPRSRSSDEYHEYNYPEVIQRKPIDPLRASRVGDDGYLIAEPEIQGLPSPGSKVYYSSRLPQRQAKMKDTSPIPKSKFHYSSRIPSSVHQGGSRSSRRSDTRAFSTHNISGQVHRDNLGLSTDPAAPKVYYSTRLRNSGNQSSELSPEMDDRQDEGYMYIKVDEN